MFCQRSYNSRYLLELRSDTARVRDFNLKQERWSVVRRWWDTDYWFSLCQQARTVAEETLRTVP